VLAKVKYTFPHLDSAEVMALLDQYGEDAESPGTARVQLSILKVSNGKIENIPRLVQAANEDYRDLIYWAENRSESRQFGCRKRSYAEIEEIEAKDRQEYEDWLKEGIEGS
jgi:hypothetical protein